MCIMNLMFTVLGMAYILKKILRIGHSVPMWIG